jgi:hypothetical protein
MSNLFELNRQAYGNVSNVGTVVAGVAAPVTPVVPAPSEEELLELIAPSIYSYHTKYADGVEASDKAQQIFMAYNGIFVRRTEKFNDNVISVISEVKKVPGLRSVKEGILVDLQSKVPFAIFEELVANYRAVYRRDSTESSAQVYRLKEVDDRWPGKEVGDYVVYYPKQKNSGANTNYSEDADAVINIRQKHTIVMESHAHANFSAFFSGGDDNNEKAPLSYCVIGHVNSDKVSFAGRVKLLGMQKLMNVEELFDVPEGKGDVLTVANLSLPEPSPVMLANATHASGGVKTAAQIAEERQKQGIVVPHKTWAAGAPAYNGGYTRNNYGTHYSGADYRDYGYRDYDTQDYGKYRSNKHSVHKADRRAAKALKKLDVEWIADNLDDTRALVLLELLTERIEAKTAMKTELKGDK